MRQDLQICYRKEKIILGDLTVMSGPISRSLFASVRIPEENMTESDVTVIEEVLVVEEIGKEMSLFTRTQNEEQTSQR